MRKWQENKLNWGWPMGKIISINSLFEKAKLPTLLNRGM